MTSSDWLGSAAPFDMVRRGFAPEQVTAYIEKLEYDLRIATANQDATSESISELTTQLRDSQSEADSLRQELDRYAARPLSEQGLSDLLRRRLRQAEAEAAEIRAQAEREAGRIRAEVDAEREQWDEQRAVFHMEQESARRALSEQVADEMSRAQTERDEMIAAAQSRADEQLERARAEADGLLSRARADAESLQQRTRSEVDALAGAAAAERARIEEDFSLAIGARRSEAHRAIAQAEAEARAETDRRIGLARDHAREVVSAARAFAQDMVARAAAEAHQRVADADAAVIALRDARAEMTRQVDELAHHLDTVRAAVFTGRESLTPPVGEEDLPTTEQFPSDPTGRPTTPAGYAEQAAAWRLPEVPGDLKEITFDQHASLEQHLNGMLPAGEGPGGNAAAQPGEAAPAPPGGNAAAR